VGLNFKTLIQIISEVIKKYLTPDKMIITAMGEKDIFRK